MALRRLSLLFVLTILFAARGFSGFEIFEKTPTPDNPLIAAIDGARFTLDNLELHASEINSLQRVPRIVDTVVWRDAKLRDLARNVIFTSKALDLNLHMDPAFLRSRDYFINEWLAYALLRDNVVNKIDVGAERLREFFDTHKEDYYISATTSIRLIRTRDAAKAAKAIERLKAGEDFVKVEMEVSEVNLRQRGKIVGPYPTTDTQATIPPPKDIMDLGEKLALNETTGPVASHNNFYVVRTVDKTPSKQLTFEEALQYVETRVRQTEGDALTRKLLDEMRQELFVEQNDAAIDNPRTRPTDIVATIGMYRMPYQEYTDLAGRVRGPALEAAKMEKTKLRQFITPYVFGEAGKLRGYTEREEFQRSMFHSDILRLGQRAINMEADKRTPQPSDMEIRKVFEEQRSGTDVRAKQMKDVPYEQAREGIRDALYQAKRGQTETQIVEEGLAGAHYTFTSSTKCRRLSGLEALVAASEQIPPNVKVHMISTTRADSASTTDTRMAVTPMIGCGRRELWRVVGVKTEGNTTSVVEYFVQDLHPMVDHTNRFVGNRLYAPWTRLWRFDTDALARHAYDAGMSDYMARHNHNVHVNCRIEFDWDGDKPKGCWIVFELRPLAAGATEMLTMKYSAERGLLQRKPLRDCLPCEEQRQLMNEPF